MSRIFSHAHNGQRWLFVPTPNEADDFEIDVDGLHMYQNPPHSDMTLGSIDIPSGNWQIVSKLSDITEEQAREMVPLIKRVYGQSYYDYTVVFKVGFGYVGTAIQSIHSLIRSLGGNPQNNEYLILKEG